MLVVAHVTVIARVTVVIATVAVALAIGFKGTAVIRRRSKRLKGLHTVGAATVTVVAAVFVPMLVGSGELSTPQSVLAAVAVVATECLWLGAFLVRTIVDDRMYARTGRLIAQHPSEYARMKQHWWFRWMSRRTTDGRSR